MGIVSPPDCLPRQAAYAWRTIGVPAPFKSIERPGTSTVHRDVNHRPEHEAACAYMQQGITNECAPLQVRAVRWGRAGVSHSIAHAVLTRGDAYELVEVQRAERRICN